MSKKQVLVLFSIIFLSSFHFAFAGVIINEVQIGGTSANDEFIELYSSDTQSLTDWYIKRKTSSGAEYSLVSSTHFKDKTINGYLLLAKDGSYVGSATPDILWPSSTSYYLADDNSIILYNGNDQEVSKIGWGSANASDCDGTCPSNPTNGNSLQLNGSWCAALPTPGLANVSCDAGGNQNTGGDTNGNNTGGGTSGGNTSGGVSGSTSEKTTTKPKTPEIITIKTKITARNNSFINIPINFKGETSFSNGQNIFSGRYLWNFGDGDSREMLVTNNEKFTHTYFYPGDYAVILEHYPNFFADTPDAIDKINIKIALTAVTISAVGDEKDFFIELTNNSDLDADISAWSISNGIRNFYFPKNTIIPVKKKMKISSRITGFTVDDKVNLKLLSPTNEVVFDYGVPVVVKPITKTVSPTINNTVKTIENKVDTSLNKKDFQIIDADLSASVINSNKSYRVWGIVFWLILVSGAILSVLFLRKRISSSGAKSTEDDFELLDE